VSRKKSRKGAETLTDAGIPPTDAGITPTDAGRLVPHGCRKASIPTTAGRHVHPPRQGGYLHTWGMYTTYTPWVYTYHTTLGIPTSVHHWVHRRQCPASVSGNNPLGSRRRKNLGRRPLSLSFSLRCEGW